MIQRHDCKIFDGDRLVFSGQVTIEIEAPTREQLGRWEGSFDYSGGGLLIKHDKLLIRLDDGRSGDIFVIKADAQNVHFKGTGPLE